LFGFMKGIGVEDGRIQDVSGLANEASAVRARANLTRTTGVWESRRVRVETNTERTRFRVGSSAARRVLRSLVVTPARVHA